MKKRQSVYKINKLLGESGIQVNGPNSWDIQIKPEFIDEFYYRVIHYGSLGLGESYMDGWWNCEKLDEFFTKILSAGLDNAVNSWQMIFSYLRALIFNVQTRSGSLKVARNHYNFSPKLYESFLDPYNQYSCGYFKNTDNLNIAQENKAHLICRKLNLSSLDNLLDIGCGWGGLAKFASENYGCKVTGITISEVQAEYAKKFTKGLPVKIKLMDYRDLKNEKFTKIVSVGMIEHVGNKNYKKFMNVVYKSLADKGLFLLHTIGSLKSVINTDAWINKYIFPNSMLPSIEQIAKASEKFVTEDLHNFGTNYDKTLMAWNKNFQKKWSTVKSDYYDERFHRMWEYYLLSCAASFRTRKNQLYQFVFSKNLTKNYKPVR